MDEYKRLRLGMIEENVGRVEHLLENFELLVSTPEAVRRLVEKIMDWALRGKLGTQVTGDESSSELLQQIKAEKDRMANEKNIAKEKPLNKRIDKKKYILPPKWEIEYLGNITNLITKGTTPTTYGYSFQETGIKFIKVENINNGWIDQESIKDYISPEAHLSQLRSQLEVNDILFSIAGTIGKTCIVKEADLPANTNQALAIIRGTDIVFSPRFLRLQLETFIANAIKARARGGAMNNVSLLDLRQLIVFIPPKAEQQRIVTKVDKLLNQARTISENLQKSEQNKENLNHAAMGRLLLAENAEEFEKSWRFIADNFEILYSDRHNIASLKQAILELAVRGKLVRQEPGDEPASALLKRIKTEKESLVKDGKIMMAKPLPPIKEEEKPFELPKGWDWVRLGNISLKIHYGYTASADFSLGNCKLLRITDIQDNKVDWDKVPGCEIKDDDIEKFLLGDGDILIARTGGTIGKSFLIINPSVKAVFASYLIRDIPSSNVQSAYVKLFLESPLYWKQLIEQSKGTGQPNVNAVSLSHLLIPLPPMNEQHRIVARIKSFMYLCDKLDTELQQAKQEHERWVEAVLA
jgi:type I restriction enzyme S subunit